jgi:SAM-dependent methyltransferase
LSETWLQRFAASVVSRPVFYDLVQKAAGQEKVAQRLRAMASGLPRRRVLDVGSSSGGLATRIGLRPICLDLDPRPLVRLRRRAGRDASSAVAGDAARLPFPGAAFDLTLCAMVFHHLDDETVRRVVEELSRVTAGRLLFLEPLRNERRRVSRVLWKYDRGRHPRSRDELLALLGRAFELVDVREFAVYHEYVICLASPRRP